MRLWRDPVVAFLAFGALVAGVQAWRGPSARSVIVDDAVVADVRARLASSMARPPRDDEVGAAVEDWVRTEILVREAVARGLEVDDPLVRAHLAAKLVDVLGAREVPLAPDEATLASLYAASRAELVVPTLITVRQVFLSGQRDRIDGIVRDLERGADPKAVDADPPPGGPVLRGRTPERLAEVLGPDAAAALVTQPVGVWVAHPSPLGWHALRVEQRQDGRQLTLDEARERLVTRWRAEQVAAATDAALNGVLARYRVVGWPTQALP